MLACALLLFVLGLYLTWVMNPPSRNQQEMAANGLLFER